jgi:hypothetical protein
MADSITIKSGALGDRDTMPRLSVDELGFRTDEKALYIGTKDGNVRLCGVEDAVKLAEISAKIDEILIRLGALETPSE